MSLTSASCSLGKDANASARLAQRGEAERRDLVQPRAPGAREVAQCAVERDVVAATGAAARIAVLDHVAAGAVLAAAHTHGAVLLAQAGSEHERAKGHRIFLLGPV